MQNGTGRPDIADRRFPLPKPLAGSQSNFRPPQSDEGTPEAPSRLHGRSAIHLGWRALPEPVAN